MTDEPIADRLRRLRRAVPRGAPLEPAAERDGEIAAASVAPSRASEAGPAASEIAAADPRSTPPRADVFARLARRAHAPWVDARYATRTPDAGAGGSESALECPVRELSLDPPRDLAQNERGTWARTAWFERTHRHGAFVLEDVLSISQAVLAERARDERIVDVDLERAVFFDTETTGLSGGAGTYVYLVGLGRFLAGRFELWQGFLPHPAGERVLLQEVADRIAEASLLVSFFGKSFDRHRLEDKMRLHGVAPPFAAVIHLDLYHPLRRAHKGQFENCRLKTLERELARVIRSDDLPGSFAPAAWFDFLSQRPHRLEGVFRHNAADVLSLVALATRLAR